MKRGHGRDGDGGAIGQPPSKRRDRDWGQEGSSSEGFHGSRDPPRTRSCFKALLTDGLTASLLGNHGSVKDEIQKATGARLVFSNRNDYFPETNYRVLGIYAEDPSAIEEVFGWVMPQLVEHGDEERRNSSSGGQTDLCGKERGEYIFRFALTRRMQSQIVGTGGSNIKFIRQDSGAKVFVENESIMGHRTGRVIGTPDTILAALKHINGFVQCESELQEDFYQGYGRIVNFAEAESRGWEPPPEPKDADKPTGNRRVAGPKGVKTSGAVTPAHPAVPPRSSAALKAMPKASQHKTSGDKQVLPPPPPPAVPVSGGGAAPPAPESVDVTEEVDSLADALESFPPGTVRVPYSLCADIPASRVVALVGKSSAHLAQVEQASGAKVMIDRAGNDWHDEIRTLTFEGSLLNVYVAHAMMMGRLKALEAQEREEREERERAAQEEREREELERAEHERETRDREEREQEAREREEREQADREQAEREQEEREREEREQEEQEQEEREQEEQEAGLELQEESDDEDPDVIREQIARLEAKLARALARRAAAA